MTDTGTAPDDQPRDREKLRADAIDAVRWTWKTFRDVNAEQTVDAVLEVVDEAQADNDQPDLASVPWRTGSHLGRTVYACTGSTGGKPGTFIGTMDTAELAAEACRSHNAELERRAGA